MADQNFSVGDKVTIISELGRTDLLIMTVAYVAENNVKCIWYDHVKRDFFEREFSKKVLTKIS